MCSYRHEYIPIYVGWLGCRVVGLLDGSVYFLLKKTTINKLIHTTLTQVVRKLSLLFLLGLSYSRARQGPCSDSARPGPGAVPVAFMADGIEPQSHCYIHQ